METTVYNPQKNRLETIEMEITKGNTTWFDTCVDADDIYMITDIQGGLVIKEYGYSYPLWIYDKSREAVGYSQQKTFELIKGF